MYPILPVFLDFPVLIAPSVYSNVYLSCVLCTHYYQCFWIVLSWLTLRFTLAFICPVSCVPNTIVSGLSCLDFPSFYSNVYLSCILCTQYYQCFCIVLSWLPLRFTLTFMCPVYPILLFLDCPVLIVPSFYSNVCLSCVLCTQYCQCFCIVLCWLPLRLL